MKCRTCGSENLHRSRPRNQWERFVSMLTTYRYFRCHDCNGRMPLRKPAAPKALKAPAPRVNPKRRMRMLVKYAKIAAAVLALLVGLYVVAAPYFDLPRPTPRQHR
jgi:DNA-directed RNA polymerase subunit RPC12/RpoP